MDTPAPTPTGRSLRPRTSGLERGKATVFLWLATVAHYAGWALAGAQVWARGRAAALLPESGKATVFLWLATVAHYAGWALAGAQVWARGHAAALLPVLADEARQCAAWFVKSVTCLSVKSGASLFSLLRPGCETEFWDAMPSNPIAPTVPEEAPPMAAASTADDGDDRDRDSFASLGPSRDHGSFETSDWDEAAMGPHVVQVVHCDPCDPTIVVGDARATLILTKRRVGHTRIKAIREKRMKQGLKVVMEGDRED